MYVLVPMSALSSLGLAGPPGLGPIDRYVMRGGPCVTHEPMQRRAFEFPLSAEERRQLESASRHADAFVHAVHQRIQSARERQTAISPTGTMSADAKPLEVLAECTQGLRDVLLVAHDEKGRAQATAALALIDKYTPQLLGIQAWPTIPPPPPARQLTAWPADPALLPQHWYIVLDERFTTTEQPARPRRKKKTDPLPPKPDPVTTEHRIRYAIGNALRWNHETDSYEEKPAGVQHTRTDATGWSHASSTYVPAAQHVARLLAKTERAAAHENYSLTVSCDQGIPAPLTWARNCG